MQLWLFDALFTSAKKKLSAIGRAEISVPAPLSQKPALLPPHAVPSSRRKAKRRTVNVSDPDLYASWKSIRLSYFPSRPDLDNYIVRWSTRNQKRTLASCNLSRSLVIVAKELQQDCCKEWIEPILYHEMCHAVIGMAVSRSGSRRNWHGKEFKALEARHPRIKDLDLWIRGIIDVGLLNRRL
jgi:hypothetical protein